MGRVTQVSHRDRPFHGTWTQALAISLVVVVLGVIGLIVVSRSQADEVLVCTTVADSGTAGASVSGDDQAEECMLVRRGGMPQWLFSATSTLLSTLIAVGAVSLIVEVGLRRRFGDDLLRFLGLKEALVNTGLAEAGRSSSVDLRTRLGKIDELRYLGRSPTFFLSEQAPELLRLAQERRLRVTFGLPDPDQPGLMADLAESMDLETDVLVEVIRAFTGSVKAQWEAVQKRLVAGTSFRVVYVSNHVPYEACSATSFSFVGMSLPYKHDATDDYLVALFEGPSEFPSSWIASSLANLDGIPAAWEDSKK